MLCCKGCHTNHTPCYRLAKNYIGTDGAVSLAKQLKYNTSLTHLEYVAMEVATRAGLMLTLLVPLLHSVADCRIGGAGTQALTVLLTRNRHFHHFEYSHITVHT